MVAKVVDASALAAMIFEEPEAAEIEAKLAGAELYAPELLAYELANICVKKCRRDPELRSTYLAAYAVIARVVVEAMPVDHRAVPAFSLRTGLTAYDASYLWLAAELGLELVTLDKELDRAARAL
ncbi:MAG TPA: type II toxin-antitoxin system VapC family toxin [Caulobacteraceae bacterium]|jgi:predicted nucleic acid-binding protein